jgi:hypothetical protein
VGALRAAGPGGGKIVIVARGNEVPEFANQTICVNVAMADTVQAKRDP